MSFAMNDVEFTTKLPLVRIQNVPGHYLGKIHATVDTYTLNFYFEFENTGTDWIASNACVHESTSVSERNQIYFRDIERVTSTDALEFFLYDPQRTDTLNANVSVTVMGTHDAGVISIPTKVADDVTHAPFDEDYVQKKWTLEVGRWQYYVDQMSST